MRIVITGYTGFIGRNLLRGILRTKTAEKVLGLARNASPVDHPAVQTQGVDLSAPNERIQKVIADFAPDAVIHCAGQIPSDPFKKDSLFSDLRSSVIESTRNNIVATSNLLDVLSQTTRNIRLIHIGTAAEYGPIASQPRSIREDDAPRPSSIYGITKLAASQLVLTFGPAKGMRPTVLRLFNPLGPDCPQNTVIGRALGMLQNESAKNQEALTFGNLLAYRDYVDVEDIISAILATLKDPSATVGEIINIGSGQAVLLRDVLQEMFRYAGYRGKIIELADTKVKPVGEDWSRADIGKAKSLLGWSPKYNLTETLHRSVHS